MKKFLLALAVTIFLPLAAAAQTHEFPAKDTNNIFTGTNVFTNSTTINLVTYTIATLPTPATTPVGTIATITDAFTAGSCVLNGGVSLSLCRNNGSGWDSLGGSGGGGGTFPPAGIAVSTGSAWAPPATSTNIIALWSGGCNSGTFLRGDGACQSPTPGGNVSNSGTPVNGQIAQWTTATTIQGVTLLPAVAMPALTGDVTNTAGSLATTVGKINGTSLAGLATGILKNTTATGVPSIATSTDIIADFTGTCNSGTFLRGDGTCNAPAGSGNVSTSGSPTAHQTAVWATSTTILGVGPGTSGLPLVSGGAAADPSFALLSLTAGVTGVLPVANGGTGTASTLVGLMRGNASAMTAAELSGDATTSGSNAVTVVKINGTLMSGLATGLLKNTTATGVPSIATSTDIIGDFSGSCSSSTFLRGDGACATPPGTISGQANGVIPLATSATGITAQSHIDDGITTAATLTATEPFVDTKSISTGTACTAAGSTATGGICMNEAAITGWSPTAAEDYIRASSTHTFLYSVNGGSEFPLGLFNAAPAGSKCLRSTGTLGLIAEATQDCGGQLAFPVTVTGGTSGGVAYFSSTTVLAAGGILNTNVLVKGGGAGAAPTNTLCDEGVTTANTLTCTNTAGLKVVNVQTGTSPPACTIGTAGAFCAGEGTAPTSASAVDQIYADSTNHTWMASQNNASGGTNDSGGATFFPVRVDTLSTYTLSNTLAATDSIALCNKATAITLTLPVTGIPAGKTYRIKEIGVGACTITPSSGNLDGATSLVLSQLYSAIDVVFDGTQWWIL